MADGSLFGPLSTPRRVRDGGLVIDLYAGGGGASEGISRALGRPVDIAANHCDSAIYMHGVNHPGTIHLRSDVDAVNIAAVTGPRAVDLLWASPTCTHHSRARGKAPKSVQLREQGWSVIRWVRACSPTILCCENVVEWEDWGPLHPDDHPVEALRGQAIKERAGETWREWVATLEGLGYVVEWRRLVAADYGTPTTRELLFVVARRDGLPIVWPTPTHAPRDSAAVREGTRRPWLPVADQIDWSIPMCSIFATREEAKLWAREHGTAGIPQRPLAEATQRRIAEGVKRFVLGKRRLYLVDVGSQKLSAAPIVTKAYANGWDRPGSGTVGGGDPLGTNTTTEQFTVAAASLYNMSHGGRPEDIEQPANTLTATPKGGDRCLLAAHLMSHYGASVGRGAGEPCPTITAGAGGHQALVGVGLVNTRNGEREGQAPRVRDLSEPAPTVTAQGSQGGVAAAWVVKHYGGVVGHSADQTLGTVTAVDHHSVGMAHLSIDVPPALVRRARQTAAFLTLYYSGGGIHAAADAPSPTIPTRDRLGLVLVELETTDGPATLATVEIDGALWIVVDISMRMLTPRELARCQGFPDTYWLPPKKSDAIARIGNSVCPQVAEAIVRANVRPVEAMAAK